MRNISKNEEALNLVKLEGNGEIWYNKTIKCEIKRNSLSLTWCGYVNLPIENYDKNLPVGLYIDIYNKDILVHGGVTWDEIIDGFEVIGFDCMHHLDLSPSLSGDVQTRREQFLEITKYRISQQHLVYRTKEFAINETNMMLDQLIEINPNLKSYIRDTKIDSIISSDKIG